METPLREWIVGIDHVGIRVRELGRARAFYEQLGFELVAGPLGSEPVAILEHPSGVCVNFILNARADRERNVLMDGDDKWPGYTHLALRVESLDDVERHLRARRIEITEGPVSFPVGRSLFVRDPDRNVIEFHQPNV